MWSVGPVIGDNFIKRFDLGYSPISDVSFNHFIVVCVRVCDQYVYVDTNTSVVELDYLHIFS